MKVSVALETRISCRAFLPDPVSRETLEAILVAACRAPSGGNLQPWHVIACGGAELRSLVDEVGERMKETPRGDGLEYQIYPDDLKAPYNDRRFKCGEDLYRTIGIGREDKAGRLGQFKRNFELFGAPVGLFVYLDRSMGAPQWADCGMFLQSIMLIAREYGLHTCPQESWAQWHETVARHLQPGDELMLFCAVALGKMDEAAPVNRLRTERAPLDEFARFVGL